MKNDAPKHYRELKDLYPDYMEAVESLGKAARECGPIDELHAHLIQLGAAAAIQSEGAVHSHVRRALAAGASREQIYHGIILLTSTIGFPGTMAALSWAQDILDSTTNA